VFLPALFCLVLISGANKKFDLGAHSYSVVRGKKPNANSPTQHLRRNSGMMAGSWSAGRRDDLPVPGHGQHICFLTLLPGQCVPDSHFPQEVPGEAGWDFDDHLGAARFLEHALEAIRKMAEITVDQILRFIL